MSHKGAGTRPNAASKQSVQRPISTVVTLGPYHDRPWWWSEVNVASLPCELRYERLVFKGKTSRQLTSLELPALFIKVLGFLLAKRAEGVDYVFTFECDLMGWAIAFWQRILPIKQPRHVILQFIMRERRPDVSSRAKYVLMKFLLSSVHKVVCSSSVETDYYQKAFGWTPSKTAFVPFHTSASFVDYPAEAPGDYIIAAGRSFRDYDTLVAAVKNSGIDTLIVGDNGCQPRYAGYDNITVLENIPLDDLARKIAQARIVVLPLQDREISTGQTILLQAMAMGKPVIATRTSGTVDYVISGKTGILVSPGDAGEMRAAIDALIRDEEFCLRLGEAAKKAVMSQHLPRQYALNVARTITQ